MAKLEKLTSVAVPIVANNVDTDQIFPSRFTGRSRTGGAFSTYFFHDCRFGPAGNKLGDFILNDARMVGAQIIVAADNYACGSARPGAVYAHTDYGIRVIIAESFGPVFAAVAYKAGLLTIQLTADHVKNLREQLLGRLGAEITVDLREQFVVAPNGTHLAFDIDPFVKKIVMGGLSEIELTLGLKDKLDEFETRQRHSLPWLFQSTSRV